MSGWHMAVSYDWLPEFPFPLSRPSVHCKSAAHVHDPYHSARKERQFGLKGGDMDQTFILRGAAIRVTPPIDDSSQPASVHLLDIPSLLSRLSSPFLLPVVVSCTPVTH